MMRNGSLDIIIGGHINVLFPRNHFISSPRAYLTGFQALDTLKDRVFEMKAILSL